jgi:hypothetical protein
MMLETPTVFMTIPDCAHNSSVEGREKRRREGENK